MPARPAPCGRCVSPTHRPPARLGSSTASGKPRASSITAGAPRVPTWHGSAASSSSMASAIRLEVTKFLSSLAVEGNVAASTQNQALSALLFPYRGVLKQDLPWLDDVVRAKRPARLPVVLTREEVRTVLLQMHGVPRLMAMLLYGAGLRLLECARLRVKDVDFARNQLVVRAGKEDKDRVTMLPAVVKSELAGASRR